MVDIKNQKAKQRKGKQHRNALNLPVFLFLPFELLPQIGFVREIDPRASKQRQTARSCFLAVSPVSLLNSPVELVLGSTGSCNP